MPVAVAVLLILCGFCVNGDSVAKPIEIVKQYQTYRTQGVYVRNSISTSSPLVLNFTTNIDPAKFSDYLFSLYLNTTRTSVTSDKFAVSNTGKTVFLTFSRPTEDYLGYMVLMISLNGVIVENASIEYFTSKSVIPLVNKPVRVIQGGSAEMFCDVRGIKDPSITWLRAIGSEGNATETVQGSRYNITKNRFAADTLIISTVEDKDAGFYFCMVTFAGDNDFGLFELRVKDRLAALWPFIGIVIEVIILAIAILVYEKRRKQQARDKEAEQKATSEGDRSVNKTEGNGEHDAETRQRTVKA